jgi:hypothetical protein
VNPSNSITPSAAHVDALLAQVADAYKALPRRPHLAAKFREALARHALPGGYVPSGAIARPLSESLNGETQC